MADTDADRDLDDEIALDVDAQAQVEALARRLLEARGGGELVVLLRGNDAIEGVCVAKDAGCVPLTPSSRARRRARRRRRSASGR